MKNIFVFSVLFLGLASMSYSADKAATEKVTVQVTEKGFEPSEIKFKAGTHVILNITRKTDSTCAMEVVIKEKNIKKELPLNKEVAVDMGAIKKGETKFSCAMDMTTGHVVGL